MASCIDKNIQNPGNNSWILYMLYLARKERIIRSLSDNSRADDNLEKDEVNFTKSKLFEFNVKKQSKKIYLEISCA